MAFKQKRITEEIYTCDECGKKFGRVDDEILHALPDGWIEIDHSKNFFYCSHHFCSRSCAIRFLETSDCVKGGERI